MCDPVTIGIASIATAAASTGVGAIQAGKARKQQRKAMEQSRTEAASAQAANQRAINRANQKTPNLGALMAANRLSNSAGAGSTMLTGSRAPAVDGTMLGRSTLLGR
jgi:hypothetical protein